MRKFQQGDVILIEVAELELTTSYYRGNTNIPEHAKASRYEGDCQYVLAEGEATGHFHKVDFDQSGPGCQVHQLRLGSRAFFRVIDASAAIVHEEHDTIMLPPGLYERKIVQEVDHLSGFTRAVAD